MFSARALVHCVALAGAATGLGMAAEARADVIVASSGPSAAQFPVGRKLSPTDRITLKENDQVTVLGASGTRVIKGAGTHRVGAQGTSNRSAYAVLTRQNSARRSRTGAVRAGAPIVEPERPNIWYVDVTEGGTMCIADTDAVSLWRPNSDEAATYVVRRGDAPDGIRITFDEMEDTADWDATRMPLTDGGTYRIAAPDGGAGNEFKLVLLPTPPNNPEDMAAALIERGCTGQLDLLATTLLTAN